MRILVVEDNPRILTFLRKGLAEEGYSVETSENGDDGFAKGTEQDFDAAIVDIMRAGSRAGPS
jgi:DNA-binding response OmpR family regulator